MQIQWTRIQDGPSVMAEVWPRWTWSERRDRFLTTLLSGEVPIRADVSGALQRIEAVLQTATDHEIDTALIAGYVDIRLPARAAPTSARHRSSPRLAWSYSDAAFYYCSSIEFDAAAARKYATENLLPAGPSGPTGKRRRPKVTRKTKYESVRQHIARNYPKGIPAGVTDKVIARETGASERTVRRARHGEP